MSERLSKSNSKELASFTYEVACSLSGRTTFFVPQTFMSKRQIKSREEFDEWKLNLTDKFGFFGEMVFDDRDSFDLMNNASWNDYVSSGSRALREFYSNESSQGD